MYAFVVYIPLGSGVGNLDFGSRVIRLGCYLLYQQLKAWSLNYIVHLGKWLVWFGPHHV